MGVCDCILDKHQIVAVSTPLATCGREELAFATRICNCSFITYQTQNTSATPRTCLFKTHNRVPCFYCVSVGAAVLRCCFKSGR